MHEKENKAEAIEIGTLQLVNISSRITQQARNMLEENIAFLQTERTYPKVSLQEALEWSIRVANACKKQQIQIEDIEGMEVSKKVVRIKQEESMQKPRKTLADDLDYLKEITKFNGIGGRVY